MFAFTPSKKKKKKKKLHVHESLCGDIATIIVISQFFLKNNLIITTRDGRFEPKCYEPTKKY